MKSRSSTKRRTCTVRTLKKIPTCRHHSVMPAQASHHNPHPDSCSTSLTGESATLQQSQHTSKTLRKQANMRVHVKQNHCSSYRTKKKNRQSSLACSVGKDLEVLLPPAVEDSARSRPAAVLLRASSSADTGLCRCFSHSACRTATRLSICRSLP